jgi:hypothetical protein
MLFHHLACDFHLRLQQIAFLDQQTGVYGERRVNHTQESAEFYCFLSPGQIRIGLEATCN